MTLSLLEIVMLPNGDIALRRDSETEEPMVRIRFSSQAKAHLQGHQMNIARAMIDAGIEELESINAATELDGSEIDDPFAEARILH